MRLFISLCLFFFFCALRVIPNQVCAQDKRKFVKKDSVILATYQGIQQVEYLTTDTALLKQGSFSFSSLPKLTLSKNLSVEEINVKGAYQQNNPNRTWLIKQHQFSIENLDVIKTTHTRLAYRLHGIEKTYTLPLVNSRLNGKAILSSKKILNGRPQPESVNASVYFESDTLKGDFMFSGDSPHLRLKGKTNKLGYLDGELAMEYVRDSALVTEKRNYQDGFLLAVKKTVTKNKLPVSINEIVYHDVIDKLRQLDQSDSSAGFGYSSDWFGVDFNSMYSTSDTTITIQTDGNTVIKKMITLFDSLAHEYIAGKNEKAIYKLTRRFEFQYPAYEKPLISNLRLQVNKSKKEITEFLDKPNLKLRKNNSDSLSKHYALIEHILSKVNRVDSVLILIHDGHFKYQQRDRYFSEGVPGLNRPDTITTFFNGKPQKIPFSLRNPITSSDSLITRLTIDVTELNSLFFISTASIATALDHNLNKEKIDSIDLRIAQLERSLKEKYPDAAQHTNTEPEKIPYYYKLYFSLQTEFIQPMEKKYLNNSIPFAEAQALGNTVICFLQQLDTQAEEIKKIHTYKPYWNDSLFTLYRDNPFHARKLETKILSNIQNAATILLNSYATELLNSKDCNMVEELIQRIKALNNRVVYLAAHQTNEKVQQLDRTLRRERVRQRIERILEL